MLWEVIKFEIKYRLNRPATYIYFLVFFALALAAISWDAIRFGGELGKIKQNSSSTLFNIAGVFSLLPGMFIASAVMGVPIIRDFEHKMESLIFTTNIDKTSYLLGRFTGSFLILLLISSGFLWGTYLGCFMPWIDHSKYLPVAFGQFLKPWLIIMMFNMFTFSCIFFATGALSRKMLFVYLQAIVLLAIYLIGNSLAGDVENLKKAAIIDPFGSDAIDAITRYWTVAEKNQLSVPFSGLLLLNRLLWLGIGIIFLVITYITFKFRSVYSGLFKKRNHLKELIAEPNQLPIPFAVPTYTFLNWFRSTLVLSKLYFKEIFRSIPFIGIALVGVILLAIDAQYASTIYGQDLYPLSSIIAEYISSQITLIIIVMLLFYSGEMMWKEKEIGFSQIFDALPTSYAVPIVSKFLAMATVILAYTVLMIPVGIIIQLFKGFTFIQPGVYLKILLLTVYLPALVYISITLFLQSIFSNKFTGYAASILFYIYLILSRQMKIFHLLLIPNSGRLGEYSDMNGFGANIEKFVVLKTFWLSFCCLLLLLTVLFYQRGTDTDFRSRLKSIKLRFGKPQFIFTLWSTLILLAAGTFYCLNVNVWNKYQSPEQQKDLMAKYEKELKPIYGKTLQPSVVNIKGSIDLIPEKGNLTIEAWVTYKNLLHVPIRQLLVQEPNDEFFQYSLLDFGAKAKLIKSYADYRFKVYQLSEPLKPGDSLNLHLKGKRLEKGFTNGENNTSYVNNGTFIHSDDVFPLLGYAKAMEIGDTDDRKKRGLKEQKGLPARSDTIARQFNLFDQRGRTNLDLTISTAPDQIAISPGYLKKHWNQNGRAYFEYQMDKPILDYFNVISGRFLVKREKWNKVNLEIYYHKDHAFNLDIMMKSLKDGLTYNTTNFGPYQYRQMRIIEFPKYSDFAQSFPNTIPFSEGIGFIFRQKPEKLDLSYYVTAHELGHQWWGHQVSEAYTVGNQMFSESLAQYSAMMVMKKSLPVEELRRYLKYELNSYLSGRSVERKKENPLDETDNQQYIHYRKGSIVNFAMQDYIGEENMNKALRKLIANYGNGDNYPTSDVLTGYIKEVTPDSLKYVVDDLYSKITLFDNRVSNPTAKKVKDGYLVTIPVTTVKYYSDRAGNEKSTPVKDYIDIGIFAMVKGKEKLIYLQREKFTKEKTSFTVKTKEKPERAGIDPIYKMIDRNTDDNTALVEIN